MDGKQLYCLAATLTISQRTQKGFCIIPETGKPAKTTRNPSTACYSIIIQGNCSYRWPFTDWKTLVVEKGWTYTDYWQNSCKPEFFRGVLLQYWLWIQISIRLILIIGFCVSDLIFGWANTPEVSYSFSFYRNWSWIYINSICFLVALCTFDKIKFLSFVFSSLKAFEILLCLVFPKCNSKLIGTSFKLSIKTSFVPKWQSSSCVHCYKQLLIGRNTQFLLTVKHILKYFSP